MPVNLCTYNKTCPIYQGGQETIVAPLALYKNVFCNRGLKGWKNCDHYLEYQKETKEKVDEL